MTDSLLLPAIRSNIGDWLFYTTTLRMQDIANRIAAPKEIHNSERLSEWIQREAIDSHADSISDYIRNNSQRFLGSLIVGVYDGNPNWSPLDVKFRKDFDDEPKKRLDALEGKLGFLRLSGGEKLFAIDGQHRVEGIKRAIKNGSDVTHLLEEEVTCIFVPHDQSSKAGRVKTRRLFTTLNKKAKSVSTSARIALDEDDGFAIVTRALINSISIFSDDLGHVSYTSGGAISPSETDTITSIVGLYELVKDLYPSAGKNSFKNDRPSDKELDQHIKLCTEYFDLLVKKCPQYRSVFTKKTHSASHYRKGEQDHILFRPAGQRAFAKATQLLVERGATLSRSVSRLLKANPWIETDDWSYILWDPIDKKMIPNKFAIAETKLLRLVGIEARSPKNQENLDKLLESIEQQ